MNDYAKPCIHELFEHQVKLSPNNIALVFEGKSLTYSELNDKANQLAHYLQEKGVKPETLVGICVNRSLDMMIALLAILKAGGAYVPFDPQYPQERLSFIAEDTGIDLLLTQSDLIDSLSSFNCEFYKLDSEWLKLRNYPTTNVVSDITAQNLAYIIYTSGSTGTPKGVLVQHDSAVNHVMWIIQYLKLNDTNTVLQQSSISFDASVLELYGSIISGAKLVMAKPDGHRDILYIIDLIQSQEVTTMLVSPSVLQVLTETPEFDQCVSLRHVCSAGETLPVSIANKFLDKSRASLFNMYGPTEAAVITTSHRIVKKINSKSVPIGKVVNNTQVYILDKNYQSVPKGDSGELFIGGIQVARGYLNRPELTQERFIKGLLNLDKDQPLYKTGDRVRLLADDSIEYLGRADHQIQLRGNRIEPGEIENRLKQHPDIKNSLVVLHKDQFNTPYLVAYLILDTSINNSEIREFLGLVLPRTMIPSAFVTLKEFPLTINGKVDRDALPEPHYFRSKTDKDYTAPTNDAESSLSKLWAELLRLDDIGIHDDFFEWGGDSLLAVELTHQMEALFQVDLPIMYIFENPTVAKLLGNMASLDQKDNFSALVNVQLMGNKTPLFYIGTTTYASNLATVLGDGQPIYGLNVFGVREAVNPDLPVTIEIIAKQFLADIQKIQPYGPYQMASYCADTIIAYELAQQLLQQGQSVSLFATIDTVWNDDPENIIDITKVLNLFKYLNYPLLQHKVFSRIKNSIKMIVKPYKIKADPELLGKHQQFLAKFKDAQESYVPQKYAGKIVSFISKESSLKYSVTGMDNFMVNKEDHKEYIINGFHDSLFEQPYLNNLADLLKLHLK